jgi:hypothetical protein
MFHTLINCLVYNSYESDNVLHVFKKFNFSFKKKWISISAHSRQSFPRVKSTRGWGGVGWGEVGWGRVGLGGVRSGGVRWGEVGSGRDF